MEPMLMYLHWLRMPTDTSLPSGCFVLAMRWRSTISRVGMARSGMGSALGLGQALIPLSAMSKSRAPTSISRGPFARLEESMPRTWPGGMELNGMPWAEVRTGPIIAWLFTMATFTQQVNSLTLATREFSMWRDGTAPPGSRWLPGLP